MRTQVINEDKLQLQYDAKLATTFDWRQRRPKECLTIVNNI